ncbi:uncharacterized protein RMCFA_3822 [Mycolicibacterium fortuitum subsp. acetamidolyticum]|uniref:Uncharacterized protein n=1 Tax=Mycolicibacterium fortuitum subsp. acetamidolyticum TaxID=144550 RepID=A0A100WSG9_MYCFO|nr:hypothetical protein [Mycolicibacterium fortuitum]MDV7193203.1 hypothetical protein [Mycolicibacterium fortuitum]MDV7228034.1 hypothetical protein [Mycolicibacterium fortuitum]GAT03710.1 uncharacterized protein RMCFA_3822 [Mycolicibacterium fortuitum subsp. acetamidolyticum]
MAFTIQEWMRLRRALGSWVKSAPDEPVLGFLQMGELLTPRQLVEAVDDPHNDQGVAFKAMLEHAVRKSNLSAVVSDLYGAASSNIARG